MFFVSPSAFLPILTRTHLQKNEILLSKFPSRLGTLKSDDKPFYQSPPSILRHRLRPSECTGARWPFTHPYMRPYVWRHSYSSPPHVSNSTHLRSRWLPSISLACRPFCKLVTAPLKIFAVPLSVGGKVGTPALRRIFVDEKSEYMRSRLEADF